MVGFKWPSTSCISMLTYDSNHATNELYRVVTSVWGHFHGSRPIWWCYIIHLVPIQSMLHHRMARVRVTCCISMPTHGSNHAPIWFVWGGFRCVVWLSWLKPYAIVLHLPAGTHTKCVALPYSNGQYHRTLNTMYLHADIWLYTCKNGILLE